VFTDHHVIVLLQTLHEQFTGKPAFFTANQKDKSTRVAAGSGGKANLTDCTGEWSRWKSFILEQKSMVDLLPDGTLQLNTSQRSEDAWKYMDKRGTLGSILLQVYLNYNYKLMYMKEENSWPCILIRFFSGSLSFMSREPTLWRRR
jgi:hypothetical protein